MMILNKNKNKNRTKEHEETNDRIKGNDHGNHQPSETIYPHRPSRAKERPGQGGVSQVGHFRTEEGRLAGSGRDLRKIQRQCQSGGR